MQVVYQDFSANLAPRWRRYVVGSGTLEPTGSSLCFVNTDARSRQYTNAQIDDYQGLSRRRFLWRPPLRLTVRARFSHPAGDGSTGPVLSVACPERSRRVEGLTTGGSTGLTTGLGGTAGFGFWNDPFLMTGARMPALPRAIWFFYASPPSNIKLDPHAPGCGWKAATLDALRPVALLLAPLAPWAVLLMNLRPLYRLLWPPIQRALNVREAMVEAATCGEPFDSAQDRPRRTTCGEPFDPSTSLRAGYTQDRPRRTTCGEPRRTMVEWHTYVIEWGVERAHFSVDGESVLEDAPSPRGPLGFVMWLDNQYLVATPWGRLRWGCLDVPGRQWMEVDWLAIEPS